MKKVIKKAQTGISQKMRDARKPLPSRPLPPAKKKTAMDAIRGLGKYVSTFGGATERDNPKQKDINIVKKLKETGNQVKSKLGLKSGGKVKKAKSGGSFPDLNKDGKITKADILKGRGVIAKKGAKVAAKKKAGMHQMPDGSMMKNSKMKSGGTMKKCRYGCK